MGRVFIREPFQRSLLKQNHISANSCVASVSTWSHFQGMNMKSVGFVLQFSATIIHSTNSNVYKHEQRIAWGLLFFLNFILFLLRLSTTLVEQCSFSLWRHNSHIHFTKTSSHIHILESKSSIIPWRSYLAGFKYSPPFFLLLWSTSGRLPSFQ